MFRKGDTVMFFLPKNDLSVKSNIRQFNGKITTITKVNTKGIYPQFNLKDCKSEFGNDYVFLGEWLISMEEESK